MISASRFYSILNKLEQRGFVRQHSVNLGGKGGFTKILELVRPEGFEVLGLKPKPFLTRGGNFITDFYITKKVEHLKSIGNDWDIDIEKQIKDKWMDIVIKTRTENPVFIAIELELSEANLENNIRQDCEKVDFLIEVCLNESIVKKAQEIVKSLPEVLQYKIGVCLLTKLLHCSKLSDVVDSGFLKERKL